MFIKLNQITIKKKILKDLFIIRTLYICPVWLIIEYSAIIKNPFNERIDNIETVQQQFQIFFFKDLYSHFFIHYSYSTKLAELNLTNLKSRRTMLNVLFLVNLTRWVVFSCTTSSNYYDLAIFSSNKFWYEWFLEKSVYWLFFKFEYYINAILY